MSLISSIIFNSLQMKLLVTFFMLILIGFTTQAQVPMNWTRDEINPGEDFTLTPDESIYSEGIKSCHIQLNSGAVPYLISDVYYITPGAEYEFSFDVFDNDTAGQVKVYADFYDTYGFEIFGQPPVFSPDSSGWQTISWGGMVPVQAVVGFVLLKFYSQPDLYIFNQTAHVWIDNISYRETGGNNLVANGGFEEWAVGIDEFGNTERLLSIYPNPASHYVNIVVPGNSNAIIISDMMGREVIKTYIYEDKHIQIDIRDLPKGLYMVSSILEDSSVLKRKWIKY